LCCQAKRKWALLESNPPGIHLMTDEKVKRKGGSVLGLLLLFQKSLCLQKLINKLLFSFNGKAIVISEFGL